MPIKNGEWEMNLPFLYSGQSGSKEVSSWLSNPQACQMKWRFHSSAAYYHYKKKIFLLYSTLCEH